MLSCVCDAYCRVLLNTRQKIQTKHGQTIYSNNTGSIHSGGYFKSTTGVTARYYPPCVVRSLYYVLIYDNFQLGRKKWPIWRFYSTLIRKIKNLLLRRSRNVSVRSVCVWLSSEDALKSSTVHTSFLLLQLLFRKHF